MSAEYYTATVTVAGHTISGAWNGARDLAGIAKISITAGRSKITDGAQAASATIDIIDPTGEWTFGTDLGSALISVNTSYLRFLYGNPPAVTFRGRVNQVSPVRTTIADPRTGAKLDVWRVTITSKDGLVDLDAIDAPGPNADGSWPQQSDDNRTDAIRAIAVARSNLITDIGYTGQAMQQAAADKTAKVGDLTRQLFTNVAPDAVPYYDPAAMSIYPTPTLSNPDGYGIMLGWTDDGTVSAIPTDAFVAIVPASVIGVPDGLAPTLGVTDAIDLIHITYTDGSGNDQTFTEQTARYDPLGLGTRAWSIKTSLTNQTDARTIADKAVVLANAVNDRFVMPRLAYDPERLDEDAAQHPGATFLEVALSLGVVGFGPMFFDGSVFNDVPRFPTLWTLLGRTATFDENGWHYTFNVVPLPGTEGNGLTLADLSADTTATLGDCSNTLSIGVLGKLKEGLSA
jgi:hypothetical protein